MDSDQLTRQARAALKASDKAQARALAQQALRADPQNYMAWMTLAVATPSPQAAMDYVQRAYRIKPDDPNVQKGLVWAKRRLAAAQKQQAELPTVIEAPSAIETGRKRRKKRPFLPYALAALILLLGISAIGCIGWSQRGDDGNTIAAVADGTMATATVVVTTNAVTTNAVTTNVVTTNVVTTNVVTPSLIPPSPSPQATIESTPHPIQPKNIAANSKQDAWATWTTTPTPTNTPTPSPTWQATFLAPQAGDLGKRPLNIGINEKWIDVNLTTQTLVAYEGDLPVLQTLISSGLAQHATVTGQFRIWLRFEAQTMDGRRLGYDYYLENVPYVMYFFEDYALHGTFWHNNFGHPMSHGCVNMETGDAGWLFNWSQMGTVVNVHY